MKTENRNRIKIKFLGLFLMAGFLAVNVFSQDFSADMVSKSQQGSFQGKIFVTKDKSRMEMQGSISISRMDKMIAWVLMPQQKTYMEMALQPQNIVATADNKMPGEIKRELLGQESVEGRDTDKYKITYSDKQASNSVYMWLDKKIKIPVKTEDVNGSWSVTYKNIKTENLDASLFEIPAGYKKMSMPSLPNMKDMMSGALGIE